MVFIDAPWTQDVSPAVFGTFFFDDTGGELPDW
jgi:hypothetical protein